MKVIKLLFNQVNKGVTYNGLVCLVPLDTQFMAMDKDGVVMAYFTEPRRDDYGGQWYTPRGIRVEIVKVEEFGTYEGVEYWKESLRRV